MSPQTMSQNCSGGPIRQSLQVGAQRCAKLSSRKGERAFAFMQRHPHRVQFSLLSSNDHRLRGEPCRLSEER